MGRVRFDFHTGGDKPELASRMPDPGPATLSMRPLTTTQCKDSKRFCDAFRVGTAGYLPRHDPDQTENPRWGTYGEPLAEAFMDVDVSSSSTAAGALRILKSCSKSLVMDLAFVLEGQSEEALPEKILGTVEWNHFDLDPDNSPVIKVCAEDN